MDLARASDASAGLSLVDGQRLFQPWLLPGERLLWASRPPLGIRLQAKDAFLIPFSLAWGGFAILWTLGAWWAGAPAFFVAFGLPFVAVGLYLIFGRFLHDAWQRRRTLYAVSNQRVLILRGRGGSARLTGRDLAHLSTLEIEEKGRRGRGTIRFEPSPWRVQGFGPWTGRRSAPIAVPTDAFEGIERARSVYDIIRRECERHRIADDRH